MLCIDSGFVDKKLLRHYEKVGIGCICNRRLEDDVINVARTTDSGLCSTSSDACS